MRCLLGVLLAAAGWLTLLLFLIDSTLHSTRRRLGRSEVRSNGPTHPIRDPVQRERELQAKAKPPKRAAHITLRLTSSSVGRGSLGRSCLSSPRNGVSPCPSLPPPSPPPLCLDTRRDAPTASQPASQATLHSPLQMLLCHSLHQTSMTTQERRHTIDDHRID